MASRSPPLHSSQNRRTRSRGCSSSGAPFGRCPLTRGAVTLELRSSASLRCSLIPWTLPAPPDRLGRSLLDCGPFLSYCQLLLGCRFPGSDRRPLRLLGCRSLGLDRHLLLLGCRFPGSDRRPLRLLGDRCLLLGRRCLLLGRRCLLPHRRCLLRHG